MLMSFKILQIILFFFLFGCNNNLDANLNITSNIKEKLQRNETIKLTVHEKFDSIKVYNSSKLIYNFIDNSLNNLEFELENLRLGQNNINVVSFFNNTNKSKKYSFILLNDKKPKIYSYRIINTYPHDINSYTQGLEFNKGFLYESTGKYGKSKLRKTEYKTGETLSEINISNKYFAEGLTIINDKIIQLTWREGIGLVYDLENLELIDKFYYNKSLEGWGLCNNSSKIFKSDGTEKIWILDPNTFEEIDNFEVYTNKGKVNGLNELEWVNGKIYANRYLKNGVAIIDPTIGAVEGVIDLSGLKQRVTNHNNLDVLNGIAFNKESQTLFVTGKMWDKIFEIEIIKK